jgi:Family of unknown function (DUF5572)
MNESTSLTTQEPDVQRQQMSHHDSFENEESIFTSLSHFPFDSDAEYLSGLSTILGHPSTHPSASEIAQNGELVLQAQCFYFSRKRALPPIDPSAYRQWLQSRTANNPSHHDVTGQTSDISASTAQAESSAATDVPPALGASAESAEPPPYPDSFAAIVDLITQNKPIPGIEEIPATVLDHGSSKIDQTPRRKKPWEADTETAEATFSQDDPSADQVAATEPPDTGDRVNGPLTTGEGVVKILQPNAIADSGLLSRE